MLIVLGPSFTTGSDGDVAKRFVELERWVRSSIPAGDVIWRWVNEDLTALRRTACPTTRCTARRGAPTRASIVDSQRLDEIGNPAAVA